MKIYKIFCFFLLLKPSFCVISINGVALTEEDYNVTWMYFPDGQNNLQIALLVRTGDGGQRKLSLKSVEQTVKFLLYTNQNSDVPEIMEFATLRTNQGKINFFNKNVRTKILIHGWTGTPRDPMVQKIKDQYLKENQYNIIAVDWSKIAGNINYFETIMNVPQVGQVIAYLIDYLIINLKVDPKSIHLIGHSLGAHVSGHAGQLSYLKIARITGLDPAKPFFEGFSSDQRLDLSDAEFVDIIHTCANYFGFVNAIGHIDFYPNSGFPPQPGCFGLIEIISCSHGRAYEYYAESINSKIGFWSYPCDTYTNFGQNKCKKNPVLMGNNVQSNANGIYYLKTNSSYPFALGRL